MLKTTKFYFIPVINVDGFALVEDHWNSDHQIINKRKNMNPSNLGTCTEENSGVDLNRNYGVDWTKEHMKNYTELCGDFWPGTEAFSEPESRALRDFVSAHTSDLKFVINCHTSGNEFIWPYNGREPNDI
jgi:carboxypeptidase T